MFIRTIRIAHKVLFQVLHPASLCEFLTWCISVPSALKIPPKAACSTLCGALKFPPAKRGAIPVQKVLWQLLLWHYLALWLVKPLLQCVLIQVLPPFFTCALCPWFVQHIHKICKRFLHIGKLLLWVCVQLKVITRQLYILLFVLTPAVCPMILKLPKGTGYLIVTLAVCPPAFRLSPQRGCFSHPCSISFRTFLLFLP